MLFNRYVLSLFVATVVSLASLMIVLTKLDPFIDGSLAVYLFFVSLFLSVGTVSSLIGYLIRVLLYRNEILFNHFNVALRQGIIMSFCISAIMGFQVMKTLTWWNGLITILIAFLLEIYFVAKD